MKQRIMTSLSLIFICSFLPSLSFSESGQTKSAPVSLERGTEIKVKLDQAIDVKNAKPGEEITAYVMKNVKSGKKPALAKGTEVKGIIKDLSYKEGAINESTLKMEFNRIILDSQEKELSAAIIDVGYSVLPSGSDTLFGDNANQRPGTGGLLQGGIEEPRQSTSHPDQTFSVFVRGDGTFMVRGAIINLEAGTRITLRLKKELQISP